MVAVTVSRVAAFATAIGVNRLVLIPRYWRNRRYGTYSATLIGTTAAPTALALPAIRVSDFELYGPDADPNGVYEHFAIDPFGTAARASVAVGIVEL